MTNDKELQQKYMGVRHCHKDTTNECWYVGQLTNKVFNYTTKTKWESQTDKYRTEVYKETTKLINKKK